MVRSALAAALVASGCMHVRIGADGATKIDALGNVHVETRACAAEVGPADPTRVCVSAQGGSLSETAGGVLSGVVGFLLGR